LLAADASAAGWKGAVVMPKNAKFQLENNGEVTATIYDIGWPAVVERTEGRNLFIKDEGGYGQKPVSGWCTSEDVIKLDGAREAYTQQIEQGGKQGKAVLYWLRGIAWENQQELEIAALDYQQAANVGLSDDLDDVELRLGRLTMLSVLENGSGPYDPKQHAEWDAHFRKAHDMYARTHNGSARPQLYLDWAAALGLSCRCTLNKPKAESVPKPASDTAISPTDAKPSKSAAGPNKKTKPIDAGSVADAGVVFPPEANDLHKQAIECLDIAAKLNPYWWRVPFSRAEIILARCERESDEGEMQPTSAAAASELVEAGRYFSQAIALNPKSPDCFRDRAEVLRLQRRYAEAKDSAKLACDMTLNRQAQCLRTMAQICAEQKDYPNAIRYAHRALQYCSESHQGRLSALFNKYIASYQDTAMDSNVALDFIPQDFVAFNDPEKPRGGPAPTIHVPTLSASAFGK
jgi:tetratricopeptide (TPR) repeat protein